MSYIPEKNTSSSKYNFRETLWEKGVITDDILDETSRLITRATNKTMKLLIRLNHLYTTHLSSPESKSSLWISKVWGLLYVTQKLLVANYLMPMIIQ